MFAGIFGAWRNHSAVLQLQKQKITGLYDDPLGAALYRTDSYNELLLP